MADKPYREMIMELDWKIIDGLTPFYGHNASEVIEFIVVSWLHENSGSLQKLRELGALK